MVARVKVWGYGAAHKEIVDESTVNEVELVEVHLCDSRGKCVGERKGIHQLVGIRWAHVWNNTPHKLLRLSDGKLHVFVLVVGGKQLQGLTRKEDERGR